MQSLQVIADRLGLQLSAVLAASGRSDELVAENRIAELEQLCHRYEYARAELLARAALELGKPARLVAAGHHFLGQVLCYLGRPDEALEHVHLARGLFRSLGDPWLAAETLDWEAHALRALEDPRALSVAEEALRRYRTLEPRRPDVEARILEHQGTILYGLRAYDRALACYEEAFRISGGVRELRRIARINHGMAVCHSGLGDHRTAIELLFKALALYEAEQRISPSPAKVDVQRVENDLGLAMMAQGDLDRAGQLLRSALDGFVRGGVERERGHVLLSLGAVCYRQGRLDEGLKLVKQAVALARRLKETYTEATGHQQLGELYAAMHEDALADMHFQRALAILQASGLQERRDECVDAYDRVLEVRRGGATLTSTGA